MLGGGSNLLGLGRGLAERGTEGPYAALCMDKIRPSVF